ncbi:putative Calcium lipid binding protein [Zostera marina]|uniref:Putative Calcium lipid binding protein n=1 Tax=Zostera marina TaxID=29655 RepID=A0A0K9Q4D3_ZOSMR|nr:putative Calcium lipid binding protein [Zostera marina]
MGLISGIFLGIVLGIALIAGWKHMMSYRSAKRIAKAVDIQVLGSLNRDDIKKICGDNCPEWISFPLYEQVKWLNKILAKMWPFIAEAASLVIKESIGPLLEEYKPPGISSIKFSKLFLGHVPPKIEGIRFQNLKKGQITMDIDLRWGGDPDITISVEALAASFPIQLRDFQLFTVIRAIFQLSEEIPCFSAVVVSLLSDPKPKIGYTLKAVGGSLTAIPGISDMIRDIVNSIVSDTLEWPQRIIIPFGEVPIDTSDLELKPQGMLKVTVIKASSLKNMEFIGKSDPYVCFYIRPKCKESTKVIDNNINPEWNEEFYLTVEDKETQFVTFEVLDEDVGQDKRLGIAKLPLVNLEAETSKEINLSLLSSLDELNVKESKDRGNLYLTVFYHEFTKEEQSAKVEEDKKRLMEDKGKMNESGVIESTMETLDGMADSGIELVGTGIGAGVDLVSTGAGAGAAAVGSGVNAGTGIVGSGLGAVGTGFGKAGRFMGKNIPGMGGAPKKTSGGTAPVAPKKSE